MKTCFALDRFGKRIHISEAIKGQEYFCQECEEKLILKKGNIRIKHFAHKPGSHCDSWGEMTEWHLAWQEKFPEECREVVLTKDGVKHKADILINNTVIEFQHSPISHEEFIARNNFYTADGRQLVWVFDMTDRIKDENQSWNGVPFKRKQGQFFQFDNLNDKVHIFFDIEIKDFNKTNFNIFIEHYEPRHFMFRTESVAIDRCVYLPHLFEQQNFLKEYGAIQDENIPSISDIISPALPQLAEIKPQQKPAQLKLQQNLRPVRVVFIPSHRNLGYRNDINPDRYKVEKSLQKSYQQNLRLLYSESPQSFRKKSSSQSTSQKRNTSRPASKKRYGFNSTRPRGGGGKYR